MITWLKRLLFPHWFSNKLNALESAKSEDFLENYYEALQEPINYEEQEHYQPSEEELRDAAYARGEEYNARN